jgi:hypothetical protein
MPSGYQDIHHTLDEIMLLIIINHTNTVESICANEIIIEKVIHALMRSDQAVNIHKSL